MKNFNADLNVALDAVRKVSIKIARDFYEIEKLQISKKGVADFVTNLDLTVEKFLVSKLQRSRPEYSFISEESGFIRKKASDQQMNDTEYRWIIDPIDGTFNFMHGISFFCISIALIKIVKDVSSLMLGIICNPISNEIFWAGKKSGAFLIDTLGIQRKIKVSNSINYEKILCTTCDNRNIDLKAKKYLDFIKLKRSKTRVFGASALEMAYLADGRINLIIQGKLNIWDYSAGALIIREAGGIIKDFNENNLALNIKHSIVAGNYELLNRIEKSI